MSSQSDDLHSTVVAEQVHFLCLSRSKCFFLVLTVSGDRSFNFFCTMGRVWTTACGREKANREGSNIFCQHTWMPSEPKAPPSVAVSWVVFRGALRVCVVCSRSVSHLWSVLHVLSDTTRGSLVHGDCLYSRNSTVPPCFGGTTQAIRMHRRVSTECLVSSTARAVRSGRRATAARHACRTRAGAHEGDHWMNLVRQCGAHRGGAQRRAL